MEAIGFLNFLPMFDVSTVTQDFNQDFNQAPKSILLTSFLFYFQFPSRKMVLALNQRQATAASMPKRGAKVISTSGRSSEDLYRSQRVFFFVHEGQAWWNDS